LTVTEKQPVRASEIAAASRLHVIRAPPLVFDAGR
jgi:hypothetical protein